MENSTNKAVLISFGAFAVLIGYIVFAGLFKLAGVYDFEAKIKSIDLVIRLVSIAIGALLFLILYKNDSANQFMHEVVTELARVTWPTSKETISATWIVLIMVLVTGALLGLFDKFWTLVIQWIL
ncbi:MAG: preprotein translocase subunit SecE [Bdellovibrionales bacterium]|nr:preprotein translocase subunit SecE [Bdellovibrionales bacterium]